MAYTCVMKFILAISTKKETLLPSKHNKELDMETFEGKKTNKTRACNNLAMAHLTMAIESSNVMSMIYKACDAAYLQGQA